jgi:hypothetical protein
MTAAAESARLVVDASIPAEVSANSSNIELAAVARRYVEEAESQAREIAAEPIDAARAADERFRLLSAALADVDRSITEVDKKIEAARTERGDVLAEETT